MNVSKRRFNKELINLKEKYIQTNEMEVDIEVENVGIITIQILDLSFPFKKPSIFVNQQKYIDFLQWPSVHAHQICKNFFPEQLCTCLSCFSLHCSEWCPAYTFSFIIKEVKEKYFIKSTVLSYMNEKIFLLVEKIKTQNNIPSEINIFQFLEFKC